MNASLQIDFQLLGTTLPTYDDQGRLSAVTDEAGTPIARYAYNALGQRVLKEVQQSTARTPYTYLYGPDGQVMGQVRYTTAGRKSQASYYVWLDDLPIAQIDLTYSAGTTVTSTTLTYLHSDHLNTPRLATNQGGNLVWSWPSDAFGVGQPNNHGSTIDVILRFPGQVADAHSGLYYNYFRDYDAETGRYVESDPIGLDGGLNTYGYVEGNPLSYFDEYGLTAEGNHKLDQAQVDRIKEQLKDPNLDKKTRNALQKKLNTHEKAMGERGSRKSKGGKIRSIRGPLIHIELACIAGAAPCALCDELNFPNPNCPVDLRCEEDNNTPASPAPVPPSFPGWSSLPRPNIIDLGQQ